jgi:hypothetical protein
VVVPFAGFECITCTMAPAMGDCDILSITNPLTFCVAVCAINKELNRHRAVRKTNLTCFIFYYLRF